MEQSDAPVVEVTRLSSVKSEPVEKKSTWSHSTAIGAVLASKLPKDEMPTANSPILEAEEVDEWGVVKVKPSAWDNQSFDNAHDIVTVTACAHCSESLMTWKEGEKNGKKWGGYFCGNKATKCDPIWYRIDPVTSEWVK
jgi:hypothetical protein